MKKNYFIILSILCVALCFTSCKQQNKYTIESSENSTYTLLKNKKPLFVFTEHNSILYSIIVDENKLYYIDYDYNLIIKDLDNDEILAEIPEIGDFEFSDDKKYICVGKIYPEEIDMWYEIDKYYLHGNTQNSELLKTAFVYYHGLYSNETFEEINIEAADYSCIEELLGTGYGTTILFENEKNSFIFKYTCDSPIPKVVMELSLDDLKVTVLQSDFNQEEIKNHPPFQETYQEPLK